MTAIANDIATGLNPDEFAQFTDILFDILYSSYTAQERDVILHELDTAGVDVRPICKRKHPA
jgi:hypothetical protein